MTLSRCRRSGTHRPRPSGPVRLIGPGPLPCHIGFSLVDPDTATISSLSQTPEASNRTM